MTSNEITVFDGVGIFSGEASALVNAYPAQRDSSRSFSDAKNGAFGLCVRNEEGHGDVAASLALSTLALTLKYETIENRKSADLIEVVRWVERCMTFANKAVMDKQTFTFDDEEVPLATTACVVKVWETFDHKRKAIIGNAGNSRVYLYRSGLNQPLSLEARDRDENVFGFAEVWPEFSVIDIEEGDRLLMLSGFMAQNLSDADLLQALSSGFDASETSARLVQSINTDKRGVAKAIVIDIGQLETEENSDIKRISGFSDLGKFINTLNIDRKDWMAGRIKTLIGLRRESALAEIPEEFGLREVAIRLLEHKMDLLGRAEQFRAGNDSVFGCFAEQEDLFEALGLCDRFKVVGDETIHAFEIKEVIEAVLEGKEEMEAVPNIADLRVSVGKILARKRTKHSEI